MKRSVILLELIVSILILSVVGVYTLHFLVDLHKINAQNLKILNQQLDFQAANLFIENRIKNSVNRTITANEISFYEVDINNFKNGNYSGYAQLEKSSKEYVFTPQSSLTNVEADYIWFENSSWYAIEKGFEENRIYFKDKSSSKKIFEHYKLLKGISKIHVKENKLYFNNSILMNNIKSFEMKQSNQHLVIDICSSFCANWVITL